MSNRRILAVALIPLLLLAYRFNFVCDDAFISFRYSRHLAEGHGLVFNVGESPPVEGYSNLLWVLWLAIFELAGLPIDVAARVTSLLCGIGLLALLVRFLTRRSPDGSLAGALFLALLPPIAVWTTSGLETMPFTLACFAAFVFLCGDPTRPRGLAAGLCGVAATLLRADGALWVGFVLVVAALPTLRDRSARRQAVLAVGLVVLAAAAHLAWRLSYYGDWVPNTAAVKGAFSSMRLVRGAKYVLSLAASIPAAALVPAAVLVVRRRPDRALALQSLAVVGAVVAGSVYVGGDFMAFGRMLVPAAPFLAVLLALALASLRPRLAWTLAVTCFTLLLLSSFGVTLAPDGLMRRLDFRFTGRTSEVAFWGGMRVRAARWRLLGRALALHTRPGESIVLGPIGAVGYETELFIFDQYGLVNREVARRNAPPRERRQPGHDRFVDVGFFVKDRPTYVAASIQPARAPDDDGMPADWRSQDWAGRVTIERHELRQEDGFAQGTELRLA